MLGAAGGITNQCTAAGVRPGECQWEWGTLLPWILGKSQAWALRKLLEGIQPSLGTGLSGTRASALLSLSLCPLPAQPQKVQWYRGCAWPFPPRPQQCDLCCKHSEQGVDQDPQDAPKAPSVQPALQRREGLSLPALHHQDHSIHISTAHQ